MKKFLLPVLAILIPSVQVQAADVKLPKNFHMVRMGVNRNGSNAKNSAVNVLIFLAATLSENALMIFTARHAQRYKRRRSKPHRLRLR